MDIELVSDRGARSSSVNVTAGAKGLGNHQV